eukprot:s864_g14.t3
MALDAMISPASREASELLQLFRQVLAQEIGAVKAMVSQQLTECREEFEERMIKLEERLDECGCFGAVADAQRGGEVADLPKKASASLSQECRHLDTVEQRRFSTNEFRYPSSPALVITASRDGKRCASTWAFNAVRLLFRQAKEACDSYWLRQVTKEKLDQRVKTGTHLVVKTHEWHGGIETFEKLKHRFTHVILSVREGFPREETWMSVATHVLHFEKLVAFDTLHPDDESKIGALTVLKDLSEHLGLSLTQRDLKEVDYEAQQSNGHGTPNF